MTSLLSEPVRLALDCLPDPSLVLDGDDTVVFANAAYTRMAGFSTGEVEGLRLGDLAEGAELADLALFRTKDGGQTPAALVMRPMAGALADRFRLVRIDQDDTRRVMVQELSSGLDVRGEFLARVSHELRTPLTAMQEGIDVVLDGLTGPLNEQQAEFLQLARRNVRRLSRLVQDTLDLGDLKRGSLRGGRKTVNMDVLLAECAAPYPGQAAYRPGGSVWVEADDRQIRQAVDHLIDNAIRHSGAPVQVSLSSGGGAATVAVADHGPGIPPDKLEEIFDEFEQLSIGPGRTVGGVGLGLSIVRLIVERHGGRVWAESQAGRGSVFYFTLKTCSPPVEKTHDNRDSG